MASTELTAPVLVTELAERVHDAGGRTFAVGGVVRDHLLKRTVFDWDIEVHQVPEPDLIGILETLGTVDAVGRAFSVFKVTRKGLTIDVSLPRRDSNAGPGHRGIAVVGDPFLGIEQASRRRDLTVNAILCDVLTGELLDPFGGLADLKAGCLRAVDNDTFLEDPLRALRVVQFAARLNMTPDDNLLSLCTIADIHELPAERIRGEWFKLLFAQYPSVGLRIAEATDLLARVFPGTDASQASALDRLVEVRDATRPAGRRLAAMLTTWLAPQPLRTVEDTLDRLLIHKWLGYPLRDAVLRASGALDTPCETDADLRRLATRAEPFLALSARHAAHPDSGFDTVLARATTLGVRHDAEPPLLQGRDLMALGLRPGPALGQHLATLYDAQLAGELRSRDDALARAQALICSASS